jgi:adhesin/invasin
VIVVKDVYNNNVAGVTVTWSTDGGTLSTASTVTDQFGQAKATLTLPSTSGVQQVTAQVEGIAEVHFLATAE